MRKRKSPIMRGTFPSRAKSPAWQREEYIARMAIDSTKMAEVESFRVPESVY